MILDLMHSFLSLVPNPLQLLWRESTLDGATASNSLEYKNPKYSFACVDFIQFIQVCCITQIICIKCINRFWKGAPYKMMIPLFHSYCHLHWKMHIKSNSIFYLLLGMGIKILCLSVSTCSHFSLLCKIKNAKATHTTTKREKSNKFKNFNKIAFPI